MPRTTDPDDRIWGMPNQLRLVESLLDRTSTDPEPDDTITETDGERDTWASGLDDDDVVTKAAGERDVWMYSSDRGPDDDIVTRSDGEVDSWRLSASDPRPQPDDDILTLDDREGDSWS